MAETKGLKTRLTDKHYQDLRRIQQNVKATKEFLSKCDKCKLDVEQELKTTIEQEEIIAALLREFFPTKPQ